MPLTNETVDQSLAVPSSTDLAVLTRSLKHPILQPLELDLENGLSPDEAAVLAVVMSPALRQERDRQGIAAAQLVQARILPNPQLAAGLDIPSFGNLTGAFTGWAVSLEYSLHRLINRTAVDSATADLQSVQLDVAWAEWQAAEAAKLAVYALHSLRAQVTLADSMDQRLRQNRDLVREAVSKELMTELELAAAESAGNQAHVRLLELRQQERDQEFRLHRLLGLPPDASMNIEDAIHLPTYVAPPSEESILDGLENRRLDLVALQLGYKSQEARVRGAILDQFPDIVPGLGAASDTGKVGTTGLSLSFPIPIFDRNQGQIAIERATRQQLFDEYANRVFESRTRVAQILATVEGLNDRIAAARKAEPSLRKLVDTYQTAVKQNQADVLSYYNAWNDLTQMRMDIISLEESLVEARISLEVASGLYNVEVCCQEASHS